MSLSTHWWACSTLYRHLSLILYLLYEITQYYFFPYMSCPCLIKRYQCLKVQTLLVGLGYQMNIGPLYPCGHWRLSPFPSAPLLVFTVSHHLHCPADFSHYGDRDGGVYPGYSKSHRSTRPRSTPKPADSWRKITGDAHKKSTSSAIFWPLRSLCPITAINTIGHSPTFWCALSSSWSHSSFSISRFFILTMPSTISDVSVPCVYSSCSAMLPPSQSWDPIFQFPSYYNLPSIYLSLRPLCICSILLLHIFCSVYTHYQMHTPTHICYPPPHSHTQTHTHILCIIYWRFGPKGLSRLHQSRRYQG